MLLLVSSSGVFVMIHTCLNSKKTEITFSDEHKCCDEKKKSRKSASIERKCCSVNYQYLKLNIVSSGADEKINSDIVLKEFILFDFNINFVERSFQHIFHSPPLICNNISIEFHQLLI